MSFWISPSRPSRCFPFSRKHFLTVQAFMEFSPLSSGKCVLALSPLTDGKFLEGSDCILCTNDSAKGTQGMCFSSSPGQGTLLSVLRWVRNSQASEAQIQSWKHTPSNERGRHTSHHNPRKTGKTSKVSREKWGWKINSNLGDLEVPTEEVWIQLRY